MRRFSAIVQAFSAFAGALLACASFTAQASPTFDTIEAATEAIPTRRAVQLSEYSQNIVRLVKAIKAMEAGDFAVASETFVRVLSDEERAFGSDHPGIIKTLELAGSMETLRGRPLAASEYTGRALALAERYLVSTAPELHSLLHVHALNLQALGRVADATPLFTRALELRTATLGRGDAGTLDTLAAYAANLGLLGRAEEADSLLARGLEVANVSLGAKHPVSLKMLSGLAVNLERLGRETEAEPLFARVTALASETDGPSGAATLTAINNQAANLVNLGRLKDAEPLQARVLKASLELRGAVDDATLSSMANYGWTLQSLNRFSEADLLLVEASEGLVGLQGKSGASAILAQANLAIARIRMKRPELALGPARAVAIAARIRQKQIGITPGADAQYLRQARQNLPYFTLLADASWAVLAVGKGEQDALRAEAFAALQDAMTGTTSQALGFAIVRNVIEQQGSGFGNLVRNRQALVDQWVATEQQLIQKLFNDSITETVARKNLREQIIDLERSIAQIDARLAEQSPSYFAMTRPTALSIRKAQGLLEAEEAAILVIPGQFGTHVVAITRDKFHWHRSNLDSSAVDMMVEKLRKDLDTEAGGATRSYDRTTAHTLYLSLVAPAKNTLAGARRLYVAANGGLAALPFGVLVTAPPQGDDGNLETLRATQWFADAYALIQIPSLQALAFLRAFRPARLSKGGPVVPFAGFGAPLLGGLPGRLSFVDRGDIVPPLVHDDGNRLADIAKLRELPSLPRSATELEQLRVLLDAPPGAVRIGAAATETAVRGANLSTTSVVAFATHGLMPGDAGIDEPGMVFTPPNNASSEDDGLLSAAEVATLKLDAELVILSACDTAAGQIPAEPGLSGLARAFFYAGARTLLASHWRIRDDIAAEISVDTLRRKRSSATLSFAEALQATMHSIRNDPNDLSRAHPAVWGPFVVVGDAPLRATAQSHQLQ